MPEEGEVLHVGCRNPAIICCYFGCSLTGRSSPEQCSHSNPSTFTWNLDALSIVLTTRPNAPRLKVYFRKKMLSQRIIWYLFKLVFAVRIKIPLRIIGVMVVFVEMKDVFVVRNLSDRKISHHFLIMSKKYSERKYLLLLGSVRIYYCKLWENMMWFKKLNNYLQSNLAFFSLHW